MDEERQVSPESFTRVITKYARVYYNRSGNTERIWSVDLGPNSPEWCTKTVLVEGKGRTVIDAQQENSAFAKAWIEFNDVIVTINHTQNIISIQPS